MLRKLTATFTAMMLALSLVPAPAFAQDSLSVGVLPDDLFIQTLPVPGAANYDWYVNETSDTYTVSNPVEFVAFANLVNGTAPAGIAAAPVSFEFKKVQLVANGSYSLLDTETQWTPIGNADNQFKGTFDGRGSVVDYFVIDGASRNAYLGLFGYVGTGGAIENVTVGSAAKVSATRSKSSTDTLHHIAGVAGYCGGTMKNCTNRASVTVSSAVVQTESAPQVVKAVGGVAGECVFGMTGCTNESGGAVKVSATSDPVGSVNNSGLVYFIGGVVGVLGDSARIGDSTTPIVADPAKHGSMSDCVNEAQVSVDTPSTAGKDRFGETAYARSVCVGGVVGYSQGSVSSCTNGKSTERRGSSVGYLRAEHASSAGGIVGSLRGAIGNDNPTTRSEKDDGMAPSAPYDEIEVDGCVNYGDVYALNAAGGIVGYAGTHTTIAGCLNRNKLNGSTYVVATRWNKPAPAGIVGSSNGKVCYCANFATVSSGVWSDESQRQIAQAKGYYAAGIAGMMSYYSSLNTTTQIIERTSPLPEVYSCYNAGAILVDSGMRQRGIVGQNDGYCHDNVLLKGVVEKDKIVYGDEEGDGEANGQVARNYVLDANDASAGMRTKKAVEYLNAACYADQWERYWWVMSTPSATTSVPLNYGYPVLQQDNPAASRTDISSGYTATCEDAPYTGGTGGNAAIPSVTVTNGSETLVQNVDFFVKPATSAVELGSGYEATVVGIGQYENQASSTYGIKIGKLSECEVTVEGTVFNFEGQYPAKDRIRVTTAGGTVINPDEYEIESVKKGDVTYDNDGNKPVAKGNYTVTVKVKPGSVHFDTVTGNSKTGTYRISPANIMTAVDFDKVAISFNGTTYPWKSSSGEADVDHPSTTLPYTGEPVKPTVTGLTYNGHELTEGVDYRVVYGNPDSGSGDTESHDDKNIGVAYGSTVGVVAVRYETSGNFTNYVNMFFNITDDREQPAPVVKVSMQRLYNPNSGEHFYTANTAERDMLVRVGWKFEGEGWKAPNEGADVYRLYNPNAGDHHYTQSAAERDMLRRIGWRYEGVGWKTADSTGVPLYRQYNPNAKAGSHNYTTSKAENDMLVRVGWRAEGIGWYGL